MNTSTLTIEVKADVRPFMRQMRLALLAARNVSRARRGLPAVVRPLRAADAIGSRADQEPRNG